MSETQIRGISICPVTDSEISLLLTLIKELAEYERMADEVVATPEILRESLLGPRPAAEAVIAYVADEPVGYAIYFHNFSTFLGRSGLYIEDIYVRPTARSKGIGKALMIYLARIARERNCLRIDWVVLNWNQLAIDFYEQLGANAIDEWTAFRLSGAALQKLSEQ